MKSRVLSLVCVSCLFLVRQIQAQLQLPCDMVPDSRCSGSGDCCLSGPVASTIQSGFAFGWDQRIVGHSSDKRVEASAILAGQANKIESTENLHTKGALIGTGFGCEIYESTQTVILTGELCSATRVTGSVIAGGRLNSMSNNKSATSRIKYSFIGAGLQNSVTASHAAVVGAGTDNVVSADGAHAMGSNCNVTDEKAIVISATEEIECSSNGNNTVSICTGDETKGVFINGIDIMERLENLTNSISPACLTSGDSPSGRRRLMTFEDCPKTFAPTQSPTLTGSASAIGKVLIALNDIEEDNRWTHEIINNLYEAGYRNKEELCSEGIGELIERASLDADTALELRRVMSCGTVAPEEDDPLGPLEIAAYAVGFIGIVFGLVGFFGLNKPIQTRVHTRLGWAGGQQYPESRGPLLIPVNEE